MALPRRLTYRFRAGRRPDLTLDQILGWCDAFYTRVNRWPTRRDGNQCLPDTSWAAVDANLQEGSRRRPARAPKPGPTDGPAARYKYSVSPSKSRQPRPL